MFYNNYKWNLNFKMWITILFTCNLYNVHAWVHAQLLSRVQLFVTPWTVAQQQTLCLMEFFRQEYLSELPFLIPGDFPNPGIEPPSLASPRLVGGFFTTEPPGIGLPCLLSW